MATVSRGARRASRSEPRRYVGVIYSALALAVAVILLPSILRPPPEQTNDSAALNPGAPPDDQADSLIESNRQAQGSGAGGGIAGNAKPTTTLPRPKAFAQCYGAPARQIESVYGAPCAPAWRGDNGGATARNVFPNEVRLALWHGLAAPTAGRINPEPHNGESGIDRTFRVLETYFNAHYQTWGRHVSFYGGAEGGGTPEEQIAEANMEIEQWKIFGGWHIDKPYCERVATVGPIICNPFEHSYFLKHRPNFYSFMMDIDQSAGLGAEFVCKKLLGRPAEWAGVGVKGKTRKFGLVAEDTVAVTQTPEVFNRAYKRECGQPPIENSYTVDFNRQETISVAMQKMYSEGVTTILLNVLGGSAIEMMSAADALGWQPEWMVMGNYGLDLNNFALIYPRTQSQHMFGINTWELPHRFEEWECAIAYKSVDPANTADDQVCRLYWHPMVILLNMIQEAGPKLTPQTVAEGMNKLGRRFPATPQWAVGGGFGPDDFSYMDDVGVVWYSTSRIDPETGAPGAYVWTGGGKRYQRGQIPADNSEMFKSGVTGPGQPTTSGGGA